MSTSARPAGLGGMPTVILDMPEVPKSFKLRVAEAQDENLVGKEYHFDRPALIGRADECDIVLPDTSASRRHARIERTAAGFMLYDQKSANGTWVGDRRIDAQLIEHLDRFRVGQTVLEFLRDDDATGDDLEMIQTTSIPVRELMQQLSMVVQSKPETRLEDEGEPIVVAGNKPFFLDDPNAMWLVESGRMDVFTVAVKDGEAAGARSYFIGVEAGQGLFGMDLSYAGGNAFLASGKSGTRIRKISMDRIEALAKEERHKERIAAIIETWVTALSRSLMRDLPAAPTIDFDLVAGTEQKLAFQKRARSRRGVVWVRAGRGELIYIGLSEIDGGSALFPVTEDVYVESAASEELTLSPVATAASLSDPSFWSGLTLYHQVLCECEFLNKKLALVDEFNRLRSKAQMSEAAKDAAYADIGAVLQTGKKIVGVEHGDAEPVFQACRYVCHALGMVAKKPADTKQERGFEENLALVAIASRFRTRMVALRGDWWAHDQGPLIAKVESTKEPVAILPSSPSSYDWIDSRTGKRAPVTPEVAATLDPFAYVFYRRFPDGILSAKDVIKFGARDLKRDLTTLITMGCVMGVLGSLTPYFTGRIFDSAIPQAERGLLVQFTFALLIAALASAAFKLTQSVAVLRIQGKMDYSIQSALWDRLLDLPSTFFKQYSSGDLADRAGGVDQIRQLLAGAGIGAILGSLSSLFYVGLMLSYSIPLAALGVVLTLIFISFTTTANWLQLRFQRQQLMMRGKISGLVLQLISGVAKLRVCGAEHHGFRVWAKEFSDQRRVAFKAGTIQSTVQVFNASFPIFSTMAIFAVLVKVQSSATGGAAGISTGDFIAFSAAYGLFLAAMQALSESSLSLLKAVPIWERLTPILATEPEIDESKAAPPPLKGAIEISHVWFRYSEDTPYILKDVTLTIKAGEYVAFVGGSGSGKSTLMRLMLGFEKPEKGTVSFDGIDLASLDLRLVRQQLGVVLQDSRLLPADVYRNIIGATSRTVDEAWEAAAAAGFDQDIRNMPMGMHTYVPEGGGGFSGGQKQRLMIARAVVNKPKILFLDEATSALDNKTQAIVTESMDKMRSTRIVIAHRLSTIVNADRIYYLDKGVLAESGSYDELMKKDGLFAELAKRQMV
jgi:NHLM bacteriocin system ABC transporter ATP-binding protein